jgi:DNA (cytosine-5)-methyltransferase 1
MQNLYEMQKSNNNILEPTELIELVGEIINRLNIEKEEFVQNDDLVFLYKKTVPLKQLFALYAVSKISTISNPLK